MNRRPSSQPSDNLLDCPNELISVFVIEIQIFAKDTAWTSGTDNLDLITGMSRDMGWVHSNMLRELQTFLYTRSIYCTLLNFLCKYLLVQRVWAEYETQ